MNNEKVLSETRQVSDFDRVAVRGNTCSMQLSITQGEREELVIETTQRYLDRLRSEVSQRALTIRLRGSWLEELEDALNSCFDRPHLCLYLSVRELSSLEVQCAYRVQIARIETPELTLKLSGTGDFKLDWLSAKRLGVRLSGTGSLRVSGQVEEQEVVLSGVGGYYAPDLDSQRARVRMSGVGGARIHASQSLEAVLRGAGSLEYSGDAALSTRVSGPGRVLRVVRLREGAA